MPRLHHAMTIALATVFIAGCGISPTGLSQGSSAAKSPLTPGYYSGTQLQTSGTCVVAVCQNQEADIDLDITVADSGLPLLADGREFAVGLTDEADLGLALATVTITAIRATDSALYVSKDLSATITSGGDTLFLTGEGTNIFRATSADTIQFEASAFLSGELPTGEAVTLSLDGSGVCRQ